MLGQCWKVLQGDSRSRAERVVQTGGSGKASFHRGAKMSVRRGRKRVFWGLGRLPGKADPQQMKTRDSNTLGRKLKIRLRRAFPHATETQTFMRERQGTPVAARRKD